MEPRALIVAYGNPLRSDDGVAWHVAELLRNSLSSDVADILCIQQLTPEIAEIASRASGAIFIDARENGEPGKICHARVVAVNTNIHDSHRLTPAQLIALCNALYGSYPTAYEVSVTGESFVHGEELSDPVKVALPKMLRIVGDLVSQMQ